MSHYDSLAARIETFARRFLKHQNNSGGGSDKKDEDIGNGNQWVWIDAGSHLVDQIKCDQSDNLGGRQADPTATWSMKNLCSRLLHELDLHSSGGSGSDDENRKTERIKCLRKGLEQQRNILSEQSRVFQIPEEQEEDVVVGCGQDGGSTNPGKIIKFWTRNRDDGWIVDGPDETAMPSPIFEYDDDDEGSLVRKEKRDGEADTIADKLGARGNGDGSDDVSCRKPPIRAILFVPSKQNRCSVVGGGGRGNGWLMPDGMLLVSDKEGVIRYAGDQSAAWLAEGTTKELCGRNLAELCPDLGEHGVETIISVREPCLIRFVMVCIEKGGYKRSERFAITEPQHWRTEAMDCLIQWKLQPVDCLAVRTDTQSSGEKNRQPLSMDNIVKAEGMADDKILFMLQSMNGYVVMRRSDLRIMKHGRAFFKYVLGYVRFDRTKLDARRVFENIEHVLRSYDDYPPKPWMIKSEQCQGGVRPLLVRPTLIEARRADGKKVAVVMTPFAPVDLADGQRLCLIHLLYQHGCREGAEEETTRNKDGADKDWYALVPPPAMQPREKRAGLEMSESSRPATAVSIVLGRSKMLGRTQSIDDYVIEEEIGFGAYGFVKKARRKRTSDRGDEEARVVIKMVIKAKIRRDCQIQAKDDDVVVPTELYVLSWLTRSFPHRNVVELVTAFEDEHYYYLVMPLYGDCVDLFDYIEMHRELADEQVHGIFAQLVAAVAHLHSHSITHGDIKDENVVVVAAEDGGIHVRLVDFGTCRVHGREEATWPSRPTDQVVETTTDLRRPFYGTIGYASPEVILGRTGVSDFTPDMWALGILLFTMVFKGVPFSSVGEILRGHLQFPRAINADCKGMIQSLLCVDPKMRPTAADLMRDPWVVEGLRKGKTD